MTIDAAHIHEWLTRQALPLWSHAGYDDTVGGFVECLTLDGRPLLDRDKRMRVQARQIYVYSHAHLLGWTPPAGGPSALEVARGGFEFLTRHYWRTDNGGFVFSATRDGTPADTRIEAYEQAFALYAFAWYHRASGDPDALAWAKRTLAFLDAHLADPIHGGYFENPARDLPRRQNPHMHLLEALLALYGATADAAYLDRARAIVDLFQNRLLDPATGTLGEFFGADWSIAPGTAGQIVEPGHHFEWVWLLQRYAEATSLDDNKRLWVQTEAIKAQLARLEDGPDTDAAAHLEAFLERLFGLYLAVGHGNWQDHLDARGGAITETAPASSFYHLFLCLTEVLRVRDRRTDLC